MKRISIKNIKLFLQNFGINPDKKMIKIDSVRKSKIIRISSIWFGSDIAMFFFNSFLANKTCSFHSFIYSDWDEFEKIWNMTFSS